MTLTIPFDNTYAALPDGFYSKLAPQVVKAPKLVAFNEDLARVMGIAPGDSAEMAEVFGGNHCSSTHPSDGAFCDQRAVDGAAIGDSVVRPATAGPRKASKREM